MLPFADVYAQQYSYPELSKGANLPAVFNRSYTYIGIPAGDYVYTYAPPAVTSDAWRLIDSTLIPKGTISIDGNIRKLHFLLEDRVIYKEHSSYDTLIFNDKFIRIDQKLLVRSPYSTEKDVYFMRNGKQVGYYSDGGHWFISDTTDQWVLQENKMVPPFDGQQPFKKLYSFAKDDARYIAVVYEDRVSFHWFETVVDSVNVRATKPEFLTFELSSDALTVFVYDQRYLGVVFPGRILFYQFDAERGQWVAYSRLKPFVLDGAGKNK
ncbi:MAG: hypothetical protein M3421_07445 [Bacteroidota bacterium]|nr:hypothetical protein [Bacteroidota bacterium]